METSTFIQIICFLLALTILIIVCGGIYNRIKTEKGIGWQFIRYIVTGISVPLIGILALNNVLSGEAGALIGAILGYVFGKTVTEK
jgi:hypothetical protein